MQDKNDGSGEAGPDATYVPIPLYVAGGGASFGRDATTYAEGVVGGEGGSGKTFAHDDGSGWDGGLGGQPGTKTSIYRRGGRWVVERLGLIATPGDGTLDEAIAFLRMQCEMDLRAGDTT